MTALDPHAYEIYRIITDYEALKEGFNDRIYELNVPLSEIDAATGLTTGYSQKLLCDSKEKWAKAFGWDSLGKMLKATGLALVMVVDEERFAPVKHQLTQLKHKRPRTIVRRARPTWLFSKDKAREMGAKGWAGIPPDVRSKMMKKVRRGKRIARRKHA